MIYFTTDLMASLYSELDYAPKRWLKNELVSAEKNILDFRERSRLRLIQNGVKLFLQSKLETIIPEVMSFNDWNSKVPTLKAPHFFSRLLNKDLKTSLRELSKNYSRYSIVESLINNSCLELQTPEFYTLPQKEEYIIYGNPAPTYCNLLCFAHELGHALYEADHPGDEIGSEVAAFIFEDKIAGLILSDIFDKNEWLNYKQAQDQLNFFLCLNEFEEFESGVSKIQKHHLFFRESLVTCWGYQGIYAWASLQRRRLTD